MSIDHPIAAVSIGKYRSAQVCERRSWDPHEPLARAQTYGWI